MRNNVLYIITFTFLFLSCNNPKQKELKPEINTSQNQNPMIEKFDYESFKNKTLFGRILPNGNKITDANFYEDEETEFICEQTEILPAPYYYQRIYKLFYRNLNIKSKETYFGGNTLIGVSEYYDEDGHLIETKDENKKFKNVKITPEKFIELLIDYKLLDKETGMVIPTDHLGNSYNFEITFFLPDESFDGKNYWAIIISGFNILDRNITSLSFDAQDGLIVGWKPEELPDNLHYLEKYAKKM